MRRILLIPGDGIGPEVVGAARAVLEALAGVYPDLRFAFAEAPMGMAALRAGLEPVPQATVQAAKAADGCLLGAIDEAALPKGTRALGRFRRLLGAYANVRPVKAYRGVLCLRPDADVVVVRENSEGLYSDIEFEAGPDAACAVRLITRGASERVARVAFELARGRRRRVTAVHKLGALKRTDGLFLEAVRAVAAGVAGGIGLAPSAVLGDRYAYFEPVHGTAPDIAGKGIANPMAAILAVAMMLDHLKEATAARAVERSVTAVLAEGRARTPDLGGAATTLDVTQAIVARLAFQ